MQNLKFMVWDLVEKKLYDWEYVKNHFTLMDFENKSKCRFLQSTGLKDKHGKEMFRHHIIRFKPREEPVKIGFVEYKQQWCGFYFADNYRLNSNMNVEIIGNIYEHPHLIEEYNLDVSQIAFFEGSVR